MFKKILIIKVLTVALVTSAIWSSPSGSTPASKTVSYRTPEFLGPTFATVAPTFYSLPAPNHVYPDQNTTSSSNLLTGTISQDSLFDEARDSASSSTMRSNLERKWSSSLEQEAQNNLDHGEVARRLSNISIWTPTANPLGVNEAFSPAPVYFSFSDRLANQARPQQASLQMHLIKPRSSEFSSVWSDGTDLAEPSSDIHRVVSRHLLDTQAVPTPVRYINAQQQERHSSSSRNPTPIPVKNSPWFRVLASRIGRAPPTQLELTSTEPQIHPRATKVNFDDSIHQPEYEGPTGSVKREPLSSNPSLANLYEVMAQASEGRNSKLTSFIDDDQLGETYNTASSRYSGFAHHHPMTHQIYAIPASYPIAYKAPMVTSRKGMEKSILVGVGTALISFLILSNIFLTLPLLALAFIHFFNGNNMFMPNNNNGNNNNNPNPNNGNNNNNNGLPNANGRKKRDIHFEMLANQVIEAIDNFDKF